MGYAPGGTSCALAGRVADKISARPGRQVVVDFRPGAGAMLGTDYVAKPAPDGCTLLLGLIDVAIHPCIYPEVPYDLLRDLLPVVQLASAPNFMEVASDSPIKSVKDLIDAAKARPGTLTFASPGEGSTFGLARRVARGCAIDRSVAQSTQPVTAPRRMVDVGQRLRDEDGAIVIVMGCAGMASMRAALDQKLARPVGGAVPGGGHHGDRAHSRALSYRGGCAACQCRATSMRRHTHTSSWWPTTWSRKRFSRAVRPGRPARRMGRPTGIIFGRVAPSWWKQFACVLGRSVAAVPACRRRAGGAGDQLGGLGDIHGFALPVHGLRANPAQTVAAHVEGHAGDRLGHRGIALQRLGAGEHRGRHGAFAQDAQHAPDTHPAAELEHRFGAQFAPGERPRATLSGSEIGLRVAVFERRLGAPYSQLMTMLSASRAAPGQWDVGTGEWCRSG